MAHIAFILFCMAPPPKRRSGVRRTIYVELRPAAGIMESNVQSGPWRERRQLWMGLVVHRASDSDYPQAWRDDLPSDLGSDREEIASILKCWKPPIPAVYCYHDVETEDYPVPSDLRGL